MPPRRWRKSQNTTVLGIERYVPEQVIPVAEPARPASLAVVQPHGIEAYLSSLQPSGLEKLQTDLTQSLAQDMQRYKDQHSWFVRLFRPFSERQYSEETQLFSVVVSIGESLQRGKTCFQQLPEQIRILDETYRVKLSEREQLRKDLLLMESYFSGYQRKRAAASDLLSKLERYDSLPRLEKDAIPAGLAAASGPRFPAAYFESGSFRQELRSQLEMELLEDENTYSSRLLSLALLKEKYVSVKNSIERLPKIKERIELNVRPALLALGRMQIKYEEAREMASLSATLVNLQQIIIDSASLLRQADDAIGAMQQKLDFQSLQSEAIAELAGTLQYAEIIDPVNEIRSLLSCESSRAGQAHVRVLDQRPDETAPEDIIEAVGVPVETGGEHGAWKR